MEDNIDEEHLGNPIDTQSENPSDAIIPKILVINPNQESELMEVHKHPHHVTHKKKWGEYLLEFFMLFLAVFLGFLAENLREHQIEKEREKQFIESFVEDLKSDTATIYNMLIVLFFVGDALTRHFKRINYRKGRVSAISAVARKVAVIICNMIIKKQLYNYEHGYEFLDQKRKRKVLE